jgi:hypothetical protein
VSVRRRLKLPRELPTLVVVTLAFTHRSRARLTAMDNRLATREAELGARFAAMQKLLRAGEARRAPLEREMAEAASELQAIRRGRHAVRGLQPPAGTSSS